MRDSPICLFPKLKKKKTIPFYRRVKWVHYTLQNLNSHLSILSSCQPERGKYKFQILQLVLFCIYITNQSLGLHYAIMSTSRKTGQRLEAIKDQAVQNRHINNFYILVCLYFQARLLSACVTDKMIP